MYDICEYGIGKWEMMGGMSANGASYAIEMISI